MTAWTTHGSAFLARSASSRQFVAALLACTAPLALLAQDLPTGGQVAHGDVTIGAPAGSQLTIRQGSDRAIVNWQSFDIGAGAGVTFDQPGAASAILNRVTGATTSDIHGTLAANGQVLLVNPNGIIIGQDGAVRADGGFVASTLGISDRDFRDRNLSFTGDGASQPVENHGSIEIGRGGYAALLGGHVRHTGTVSVPMGRIGFASGERVTLDLSGDGFLQVAVPTTAESAEGEALIEVSGQVRADGGRVEMLTATARQAARHAINLSGVAEANSVSVRNGAIVLGGGAGGQVTVQGTLRARAPSTPTVTSAPRPPARPTGGLIEITGRDIALNGALLDVSGPGGGGDIRIGGDFAGADGTPRARTLGVDAGTRILADAREDGDGGRVVLWSDEATTAAPRISARGGPEGGDGGFVEVSSPRMLSYSGMTDTRAPNGDWGTLLLDPTDILIDPAFAATISSDLATTDVFLTTDDSFSGSDFGDILVTGGISWNAPTTLTFFADNDVIIRAPITNQQGTFDVTATRAIYVFEALSGDDGTFVLDADGEMFIYAPLSGTRASFDLITSTLGITLAAPITAVDGSLYLSSTGVINPNIDGAVNVGSFVMDGGDWDQVDPVLAAFNATSFSLIQDFNQTTFRRATGGDGSAADPYVLVDVYGLQGMNSTFLLDRHFALGADIDASGTVDWVHSGSDVSGFYPIGSPRALPDESTVEGFTGSLTGRHNGVIHTIDGLFIENSFTDPDFSDPIYRPAGMFYLINPGGTVSDLILTNVDVAGSNAGALASINLGTVRSVSTGGVVFSSLYGGGLIGNNGPGGVVIDTLSDATVSGYLGDGGAPAILLGGLVGLNQGSILRGGATGDVTAEATPGSSLETIYAGGLVGYNDDSATITDSYALGDVINPGSDLFSTFYLGGLVGQTFGAITTSYSAGSPRTFGLADGTVNISGLANLGDDPDFGTGSATGSFWDITASGVATSDLGTGLTTTQFQTTPTFLSIGNGAGWDFTGVWAPGDTGQYPLLYTTSPVVFAVPNDLTLTYGQTAGADATGTVYGGPALYVFDNTGNSLDTSVVFNDVLLSSDQAGTTAFILSMGSLSSTLGPDFDVVDLAGSAVIDPAALTITALDRSKVYGQTFTFAGTEFTTAGLVAGDSVTSATLTSAGAAMSADVAGSPYVIAISGATGSGLSNYEITYVTGSFAVTPATLTITASDAVKTYGQVLSFAGTEFTANGLVTANGDTVTGVQLTSDGAVATATVAGSPYAIVASGAAGSGLSNYDIVYESGALTVDPASLVITASDISKIFGRTYVFDGTEFMVTGLLNGDQVSAVNFFSYGTPADAASGEYAIAAFGPTGTGLSNYEITFVDGLLTVTGGPPVIDLPLPPPGLPPLGVATKFNGFTANVDGGVANLFTVSSRGATAARQTLGVVDGIAQTLEAQAQGCAGDTQDVSRYLSCLSDALNEFANSLDDIAADLPPGLENVAQIVQDARRQVDGARARAESRLAGATTQAERDAIRNDALNEAIAAVDNAVSEIASTITLVSATDPELASLQRATITEVASAMNAVSIELTQAVGF